MRFLDLRVGRMGGVVDLRLDDLGPGLNIVLGPNEAGKTTLKEFMGSMLFGRTRDAYPRGEWEGDAMVSMDDGRIVELSHSGRSSKPALEAPGLFAGVDASVYRRVFSLGLEDLDTLDVGEDSLTSGLIASGMGVSELPKAISEVDRRMGDLFRPRGRKQVIPSLRAEIRSLEATVREGSALVDEHRHAGESLDALNVELESLGVRRASVEALVRRDRSWVAERDAMSSLAGLRAIITDREPDPTVPMGAIESLDAIVTAVSEREEGLRDAELSLSESIEALEAIGPEPELTVSAEAIYEARRALEDLRDSRSEAARTDVRAREASGSIGVPTDRLRMDARTIDAVRSSADQVRAASSRVETLEATDHGVTGLDRRAPIVVSVSSIAVGAALVAMGEVAGALAAVGIGLGSALLMRVAPAGTTGTGVVDARARLAEAERGLASALSRAGLPTVSHLSVERTISLARDAVQANSAAIAAHRSVDEAGSRLSAIAGALGIDDADEMADRIDSLEARHEAEERDRTERERLTMRVEESRVAVERAERRLALKRAEMDSLLGGRSEADFRRWVTDDSELRGSIDAMVVEVASIRSRIGEDGMAELEDELSKGGWEPVLSRLSENESSLSSLSSEIDALHEWAGALMERTRQLESMRGATAGQMLESRRGEISEAAREWAVHAIARELLVSGMRRFEEERQPEMVLAASAHLERMSPGSGLLLTADGRVEVKRDRRTGEGEWSSGLSDQVFLSLRLALASEYMDERESLPMMLDDVTCRCDPSRRAGVASAIVRMSTVTQVFVFTCHPDLASMLSNVEGARLHRIGGDPERSWMDATSERI